MKHAVVFLLGCLLSPLIFAEDPLCADFADRLTKLKAATTDEERKKIAVDLTKLGQHQGCYVDYAVSGYIKQMVDKSTDSVASVDWFKAFVQKFEATRTDKQAGDTPASAGTTSVISRGASAKALSFATEYGAMTQSVQGQVVTFAGNLAGVPSVLLQKDIMPYCDPRRTLPGVLKPPPCISDPVLRALRRVSFSVSFDASRNSQTVTGMATAGTTSGAAAAGTTAAVPVNFNGTGREISSLTGRVELLNHRDVLSDEFQKTWKRKITDATQSANITTAAKALKDRTAASIDKLIDSDEVAQWQLSASGEMVRLASVASVKPDELDAKWRQLVISLIQTLRTKYPDFDTTMMSLREAAVKYGYAEDSFIDSIAVKPILTFEYVDSRPLNQTSLSTLRLIGEKGSGKWNFAFNAAFTFYDSSQPPTDGKPTSRWRDAQAGGLAERKLGILPLFGAAALDTALYYQYQNAPVILKVDPATPVPGVTFTGLPSAASAVFAEKGYIILGQIRLVLAPGTSSVRIPISFTGSNRTELIAKPTWRAQIGVSYDLDQLFAK